MTYTHFSMNELCLIEHYLELGTAVEVIAEKLSRSLQPIYNVIQALRKGQSIQEYYETYQANNRRCGRKKTF